MPKIPLQPGTRPFTMEKSVLNENVFRFNYGCGAWRECWTNTIESNFNEGIGIRERMECGWRKMRTDIWFLYVEPVRNFQ